MGCEHLASLAPACRQGRTGAADRRGRRLSLVGGAGVL